MRAADEGDDGWYVMLCYVITREGGAGSSNAFFAENKPARIYPVLSSAILAYAS